MKNILPLIMVVFLCVIWSCNNRPQKSEQVPNATLDSSAISTPIPPISYLGLRTHSNKIDADRMELEENLDVVALSKKDLSVEELRHNFDATPEVLTAELKARDASYGVKAGYSRWSALQGTRSENIVKALMDNAKSIYGADDRQNAADIDKLPLGSQAIYKSILSERKTVCGIFYKADFTVKGQKIRFNQPCPTLQESMTVCDTERFAFEPVSPFCTGFGLAPNRIITAGHCLKDEDPSQFYLIFGFEMTGSKPTDYPMEFDLKDVFEIKSIVKEKHGLGSNVDYCVLETNKPLPAERIAKYRQTGTIETGQRIFVIGHPWGLPLKLSPGANVRGTRVAQNGIPEYFVTNLDTYAGNSGSPVFNQTTHEVEGILIRGDNDYVMVGNCKVSLRNAEDGGLGEDVVRIINVLPYIR